MGRSPEVSACTLCPLATSPGCIALHGPWSRAAPSPACCSQQNNCLHFHRNGNRSGRGVFSETWRWHGHGLHGWRTCSMLNSELPRASQGCRWLRSLPPGPVLAPFPRRSPACPLPLGSIPRPVSRLQADPLRAPFRRPTCAEGATRCGCVRGGDSAVRTDLEAVATGWLCESGGQADLRPGHEPESEGPIRGSLHSGMQPSSAAMDHPQCHQGTREAPAGKAKSPPCLCSTGWCRTDRASAQHPGASEALTHFSVTVPSGEVV